MILGLNIFFQGKTEDINKNDICVAITTSGNSENIIEAFKSAKKLGVNFYAMFGNNGGKLKKICKNIILIPSKITSQIREIFLGQIFL